MYEPLAAAVSSSDVPASYDEMELPDETERYVFNAIAVKLIFENPENYGFDFTNLVELEPLLFYTTPLALDNSLVGILNRILLLTK